MPGNALRSFRIGGRLSISFALLIALTVLAAAFAVWQLRISDSEISRLERMDRQVIALTRVNNDVLRFAEAAEDTAVTKDLEQMRRVLIPLRSEMLVDINASRTSMGEDLAGEDHDLLLSLISYFELAIPNEIQSIADLADAGDWQAIQLRIENQVNLKNRTLTDLTAKVDRDSRLGRRAALDVVNGSRERTILIWIICGISSVLLACLLGVSVTRSVTGPLGRLEAGAAALASGDFGHRISVVGQDELAVVSAAFNHAASCIEESHNTLEQRVAARTSELLLAREQAEAASRSTGEFLANMSHEIRTPLNGILGVTDLVLDSPLTQDQRKLLSTVKTSGECLLTVINDVLDFSRIEAGRMSINPGEYPVKASVEDALEPLKLRAEQKGLTLRCSVAPEVPEVVLADGDRIRQILTNLVGNAVKFTNSGSIDVSVTSIVLDQHTAALTFAVRDTGIGIAPGKQATIFDSFTQADGSITRLYGGTGLGLTISSRLVQLMEGRIWVDSRPGEGSCFQFTIPVPVLAGTAPATVPLRRGSARRERSLRVLLAEDNPVNAMLATRLLEGAGHSVTPATDGAEAIETFRKFRSFDVILMDVQMPQMDGFEATRRIRETERELALSPTPVIALTAHAMKGDNERCLQAGMDDYLTKPIKKEILYAKLEEWAGARAA